MDINIDALYNILKQNQGDVNDVMGLKKKTVVVTSDSLALIAEKTKVNKSKEKVVVSSDSEGSGFANKKQEFVQSDDKKVEKKDDEKKRDISRVKCYNCKKEGHFAKDCKKAKEINANMVFMAQIEKVLSDSETSSSSADEKISEVSYYLSESESKSEYETSEYKDFENQNKDLQDKYNVLKNQATTFEMNNKELNEQLKVLIKKNDDLLAQTKVLKDQIQVKHFVIDTHVECQEKYAKLEAQRYEYMIRYSAYFDNDKQHRKQIADQEVLFDKMSVQLVELDKHVRDLKNTVLEKDFKTSELEECVRNKDLEIEKCLERLNVCENKLHKMGQTNQTVHMIMHSKDILYNGRKGIGFDNPKYFKKAKDLRHSLYYEKVISLGYTLMFLTHSDEALEIEKFKRAGENKIEFAYDYGNLNANYVNEKINFLDDYFQEIINPKFENIDSPFQQTSSLKPYVSNVILEKIIIDLEDEVVIAPGLFKLSVSQSVSPISMSKASCDFNNIEMGLRRVVPKNYNPKGERFLIASRFPTLPLTCAFFIPRATVKQVDYWLRGLPEADHCQPPQYTVNLPIFKAHNDLLNANNDLLNYQNKITIAQNKPMEQLTSMCAMIPACCDDDDDYNSAITPNEPVDSLSMGNEHLDTVSATKSDKFIKSCAENLVPNPSEFEGENKENLFEPFFEEEIIPINIVQHHDNAESTHDFSLIISSKIDSLLYEFTGELTLLKSIPPGIDETDCDPEEDILLIKRLLYDNSSPRLLEEFVSENSNADIESFSPSPIPVEDSGSFMEEIDLSCTLDEPMPPGIKEDDDDSKRDILILE
nr:RNA-directed DNA polymerase, eukaryota [Tanacetum cinerariifolium]